MPDVVEIADKADLIVNGYAFTKCDMGYRVLNLDLPERAVVLSEEGESLETTMDDIEIQIVRDYFMKNKGFMEDE